MRQLINGDDCTGKFARFLFCELPGTIPRLSDHDPTAAEQHHQWMETNHQARREELERFAAKDFIDQQITAREQEGLTRLQREHLDRNLRLLVSDPTAFAQQIQQTFVPPEQEQTEG